MVCHILCPECAENLGELYPFYEKVTEGYCEFLIKQNKDNIHIDKLYLKANIIQEFDFIFNALNIKNMCCRVHILGTLDFDSLYF